MRNKTAHSIAANVQFSYAHFIHTHISYILKSYHNTMHSTRCHQRNTCTLWLDFFIHFVCQVALIHFVAADCTSSLPRWSNSIRYIELTLITKPSRLHFTMKPAWWASAGLKSSRARGRAQPNVWALPKLALERPLSLARSRPHLERMQQQYMSVVSHFGGREGNTEKHCGCGMDARCDL